MAFVYFRTNTGNLLQLGDFRVLNTHWSNKSTLTKKLGKDGVLVLDKKLDSVDHYYHRFIKETFKSDLRKRIEGMAIGFVLLGILQLPL